MFNWFKKKLDNLIPHDIEKGFMSSVFTKIKLNDTITIPANMVCFLSYKDKFYNEISNENFSFSKDNILELYNKQKKGKSSLKKLKIDLFFVNLKTFDFNFNYTDKIKINNVLQKVVFDCNVSLNVTNAKQFCTFVCEEFYDTPAEEVNKFILNIIEDITRNFFLRKKLPSHTLAQETMSELTDKIASKLGKIGLNLNYYNLSLTSKDGKSTCSTKSIFGNQNDIPSIEEVKTDQNTVDQIKEKEYTTTEVVQNKNICPRCGAKIIKGSIYCHRCGHIL